MKHLRLPAVLGLILTAFVFCSFSQLTTNRAGKRDISFGTSGSVVVNAPANYQPWGPTEMTQLPDGRIILMTLVIQSNQHFTAIYRFHEDGQLDNTFGKGGSFVLSGLPFYLGQVVSLQPNGKILVGGSYGHPGSSSCDFMIFRLNSDGVLDPSFGNNGVYTRNFALRGELGHEHISSLSLQPDGKMVATGVSHRSVTQGSATAYLAILRLNVNGTNDQSFGDNGAALIYAGVSGGNDQDFEATDVTLQPDGKVIAGTSQVGVLSSHRYITTVVRLSSDGTLDPDFSQDGKLEYSLGYRGFHGVKVLADGKILTLSDVSRLARLNSDGTFDLTFGENGEKWLEGFWHSRELSLTADNKIVVVGEDNLSGNLVAQIRQFYSDGTTDIKFGIFGVSTVEISPTQTAIRSVEVESDGSILIGGDALSSSFSWQPFVSRVIGRRKL